MKILVKCPATNEGLIASTPFLSLLHEKNQENELAVIVDEGVSELIPYLRWPYQLYTLPERWHSMTGVHKFSVNQHDLFNIEAYYDLESSLVSAYLGWCFKAKKRMGFGQGISKWFYHQRWELDQELTRDRLYLAMIQEQEYHRHDKKEGLTPGLFKEQVPEECLLAVLELKNDEQENFWVELLNQLEGQKIFIVELSHRIGLDRFYARLEKKNEFFFDKNHSPDKTLAFAQRARGVLTNRQDLAWCFGLHGADVASISPEAPLHYETLEKLAPHHFTQAQGAPAAELVDELHRLFRL